MRLRLAALTLVAFTSHPFAALAQESAPPAAPARTAAPQDVVIKHDGSMLRGTIIEMVANDFVEIQLVNGQTRRVPMSEVKYAGPANEAPTNKPADAPPAEAPPSAPRPNDGYRPLVTVRGSEANLSVRAEGGEGLTLRRKSGSATVATGRGFATIAAYDELCTAPCELTLPAGTYSFNVRGPGTEASADADPVTLPSGESTLEMKYESRAGARAAGFVALVGGLSIGSAAMLVWAAQTPEEIPDSSSPDGRRPGERSNTLLYVGGATMVVAGVVGLVLILQHDSTSLRVIPGVPSGTTPAPGAAPGRSVTLDAHHTLASLQGLSLVGTF